MSDVRGGAEFRVGSVISRGISTYFANFLPFIVTSVIAYLPALLISVAFQMSGLLMDEELVASAEGELEIGVAIYLAMAALFLVIVGSACWLTAGITHGVITALRRGHVSIGESLKASSRSIVPVLLLSVVLWIVFVLVFAVGAILSMVPYAGFFAIPGVFVVSVYFACRWWVAIPAIVVDGVGPIRALGRASELTKGCRWRVFAVMAIWVGLIFVLSIAFLVLMMVLFGSSTTEPTVSVGWGGELLVSLINLVMFGLGAAVIAVGYHDLRIAKEGGDATSMARTMS